MADLNVSTGTPENQETIKLSTEAQMKVDAIAQSAISVLDKNLDAQSAISKLF